MIRYLLDKLLLISILFFSVTTLTAQITIDSVTMVSSCHGKDNGAYLVHISGEGPPYNEGGGAPAIPGNSDFSVNPVVLADYASGTKQNWIVVENSDGSESDYFDVFPLITELDSLEVTASVTSHLTCHAADNGVIEASALGGEGTYTYTLKKGSATIASNATGEFTGLEAGNDYRVFVTDAYACGPDSSNLLTVNDADEIIISLDGSSKDELDCNGDQDGTLNINVIGGSGTFSSYSWTTADGSGLVPADKDQSSISAGTYNVTVTDDEGCTGINNFTVIEPNILDAGVITEESSISCAGDSDGELQANPSGGTTPYDYLWDDPATQTTQIATGLSAGTYNVTVTDANGCTDHASYNIADPSAINVTETITDVTCHGDNDGEITLTVVGGAGGYTYNWNSADGSGYVVVDKDQTALGGGTYDVTVTDASACTVLESYVVNEPSELDVTIINPLNGFQCGNPPMGEVKLAPLVSGGTGAYSFAWTDDADGSYSFSDSIAIVPKGGFYRVKVTDVNSCEDERVINFVSVFYPAYFPDPLNIDDVQAEAACEGMANGSITISASGGSGSLEYQIVPGSGYQAGNVFNVAAGNYDIYVRDDSLCVEDESVTVDEVLAPIAYAGDPDTICSIETTYTFATAFANHYDMVSWSLTEASGFFTNNNVVNAEYNIHSDDYTRGYVRLSLTALGNSPCANDVDEVQIVIDDEPTAEAGDDGQICGRSDFLVTTASATNYSSVYWSTSGSGSFSNGNTLSPTYHPSEADSTNGSVTLILHSVGQDDCSAFEETDFMTLTIFGNPISNITPDPALVCEDVDLLLNGNPQQGTQPYVLHEWAGAGASFLYQTTIENPTFNHNIAGTYSLTYKVTDAAGCTGVDDIEVQVFAAPTATASSNSPVCVGSPLTLSGGDNGMSTYAWSGPDSYSSADQSPLVSGSATLSIDGIYTLTVTDAAGCTSTASTTVTVNALPTATASSNSPVCEGSPLTLSGGDNGMSTYAWSGPDGYSSADQSPLVSGSSTLSMDGTYTLTVTDGNGCTETASTVVEVNALPTATAMA